MAYSRRPAFYSFPASHSPPDARLRITDAPNAARPRNISEISEGSGTPLTLIEMLSNLSTMSRLNDAGEVSATRFVNPKLMALPAAEKSGCCSGSEVPVTKLNSEKLPLLNGPGEAGCALPWDVAGFSVAN